jgi:hypothetical protein
LLLKDFEAIGRRNDAVKTNDKTLHNTINVAWHPSTCRTKGSHQQSNNRLTGPEPPDLSSIFQYVHPYHTLQQPSKGPRLKQLMLHGTQQSTCRMRGAAATTGIGNSSSSSSRSSSRHCC